MSERTGKILIRLFLIFVFASVVVSAYKLNKTAQKRSQIELLRFNVITLGHNLHVVENKLLGFVDNDSYDFDFIKNVIKEINKSILEIDQKDRSYIKHNWKNFKEKYDLILSDIESIKTSISASRNSELFFKKLGSRITNDTTITKQQRSRIYKLVANVYISKKDAEVVKKENDFLLLRVVKQHSQNILENSKHRALAFENITKTSIQNTVDETLVGIAVAYKKCDEVFRNFQLILIVTCFILFTSLGLVGFLATKLNEKLKEKAVTLIRHKKSLDVAVLVSETDLDGCITYANEKFKEISQYSDAELIGENHRLLNSGTHSKEFWSNCWDTIKKENIWKGEVCNRSKDGSLYWVMATILPIFDSHAKAVGYTAIRVDITDKREAEKTLQHQSKLASIGSVAAGVGHEINNPLAICVGNISLLEKMLRKETINKEDISDKIKKISNSHERIRKIVDGLRTFSRVDSEDSEVFCVKSAIDKTVSLVA
ncbi:MAG: PAS domain S-box protein, partial [Halobacteriovoraceae bacterium]|nr:PAS domain S-box protein [Halobacteriovoraceae bacterium]